MAKLGEYASFIMGQAPESSECNTDGTGTPFVKAGQFGESSPEVNEWTTNPLKMAEKNDVLICVVGATSGKLNRGIDCAIGRSVAAIRPNENVNRDYIYYGLHPWIMRLRNNSQGSAIGVITKDMLDTIEMPFPNINEQNEIVTTLQIAEQIIRERRKELKLLDELIQARFIEMFGDPVINSMKWSEALIGDNCFVTKLAGFEYTQYINYDETGDVVMVKAQNVKNGKLNRKDLSFISEEVSNLLPRSQLAPGDVVMTYVGANIGDVAVIDDEYKYHLAPNVAKIRLDSEIYDSTYFMYMLMLLNTYIVKNSADTAKAALGMERIRKLRVFVPPIELQNQFADFVRATDKLKVT